MKIDIWSDVRCPFCYIGKRKFEKALAEFPHKDKVEVEWHSFQLDPGLKTEPALHTYDYLARLKGMSREETEGMHNHVRRAAETVGLVFDFDRAVVANSYQAHRLIQLAKTRGLGDEAEELLFRAHFTEGRNIDDVSTLVSLGTAMGLDSQEVNEVLASDRYGDKVREDEMMARHIGIRGVPFFLVNRKYAVSGAQDPAVFLQTLERAWDAS